MQSEQLYNLANLILLCSVILTMSSKINLINNTNSKLFAKKCKEWKFYSFALQYTTGVGNLRPVGHMQPTKLFKVARQSFNRNIKFAEVMTLFFLLFNSKSRVKRRFWDVRCGVAFFLFFLFFNLKFGEWDPESCLLTLSRPAKVSHPLNVARSPKKVSHPWVRVIAALS